MYKYIIFRLLPKKFHSLISAYHVYQCQALEFNGNVILCSYIGQVQNEQALVARKKAEFDALLRNPYQGPQSKNSSGFGQGNVSPFLSTTQPSTNTVFGVAQNAPTPGFGKPQMLFGVQSSASQQPA